MDTRMSKYEKNDTADVPSRVARNTKLYAEINNNEIDRFTLRSNATVIGKQEQQIDIEKIKKILDTKYKDMPKRKSIRLEENPEEDEIPESPTKEYDLNVFLEKARDEKDESYEEARAKKLRDTQFDILKNLHISEPVEPKEKRPEDNDLLNLINTITINEQKDKTDTLEKITLPPQEKPKTETPKVEVKEDTKENKITDTNAIEEIKDEIAKVEKTSKVMNKTTELDESFYTSNIFKKKDLSTDESDEERLGLGVKILIVLVIVGFLLGLFFFLKSIISF